MAITLISTLTATGSSAVLDFTSIPQTFTDLKLVFSVRQNGAATNRSAKITFNGSSATAYNLRWLQGDGSASSSASATNDTSYYATVSDDTNATANTFASNEIYIPNYAGSTQKSFSSDGVTENNATAVLLRIGAGLWANTAAITQVTLTTETGNWVAGSTASLYGIQKGSSGGVTVA